MKPTLILAILVTLAPAAQSAAPGPEIVLPASPRPAHDPHVAFGDGRHLVVWQSGRAEHGDIYACRLGADGRALDGRAFAVSNATEDQGRPRVAAGGEQWLVVWADLRNGKDYDVYAARVSGDGKVLDAEGILVAGGADNQCRPDVAWNGQVWLVIWRAWEKGVAKKHSARYGARGARISPEGRVLDTKPLAIGRGSVTEPRVASAGGNWMVAWADKGACTATVTAQGKITHALAVRNKGMDNVRAPVTIASNRKDGYLISWRNGTTGGRSGTVHGMPYGAVRVDSTGKALGQTQLGGKEVAIEFPCAAWDGKGYAIVHFLGGRQRDRNRGRWVGYYNKVAVHLVSADGEYEGKVPVASTVGDDTKTALSPPYAPAGCGDGKGGTLVVYEKHPAKAGETSVIAARLVKR